jgi:hypothetical protein
LLERGGEGDLSEVQRTERKEARRRNRKRSKRSLLCPAFPLSLALCDVGVQWGTSPVSQGPLLWLTSRLQREGSERSEWTMRRKSRRSEIATPSFSFKWAESCDGEPEESTLTDCGSKGAGERR